eukprot:scaffold15096_cov65-Isochrysis_galbana.AAC.1
MCCKRWPASHCCAEDSVTVTASWGMRRGMASWGRTCTLAESRRVAVRILFLRRGEGVLGEKLHMGRVQARCFSGFVFEEGGGCLGGEKAPLTFPPTPTQRRGGKVREGGSISNPK